MSAMLCIGHNGALLNMPKLVFTKWEIGIDISVFTISEMIYYFILAAVQSPQVTAAF